MADRPARIRLMLESGSFLGGLQQAGDRARSIGLQIGRYLKAPVTDAVSAIGGSIRTSFQQVKGLAGMAAGIAGGFSVAGAVKGAVELQATYRDLANQINRLKDTGKDWHDVQLMIEDASAKSGKGPEQIAAAFKEVYSATGDLAYSQAAIRAIGTASRATGEDVVGLAMPMQLAARKFGVGADQVEEAIARIIEKIGVGGADLSSLNMRFAVMAGEASAAGLKGTEGLSALLGIMLKLDSTIGEKASPGLKAMFQYLKDNTTQLRSIEKQSGLKFKVDTTAFDKLRQIIGSARGRKTAEMVFTADSRVVYDTLVQPFKDAFDEAKKKGASVREATAAGYAAYDKSMRDMTVTNAKFSRLQEQASERLRKDPSAIVEQSMNRLKLAFTQPEMMDALEQLAKVLPGVVSGLTKLVDFTVKHPVGAAAAFVGGRAALAGTASFAGTMTHQLGSSALRGLGTRFAAEAAASGKWQTIGKLSGAALGIAAGAILAEQLGELAIDKFLGDSLRSIEKGEGMAAVGSATAATNDRGAQMLQLSRAREERTRLKEEGPGILEQIFGGLANVVTGGDVKSAGERHADAVAKLDRTIDDLESALSKGSQGSAKVGDAMRQMARDAASASLELRKIKAPEGGAGGSPPPSPSPRPGVNGLPPAAPRTPGYAQR